MDISTMKIGCIVAVTLSSSNQLVGEYIGYKEDPRAIVLKNVRFLQEKAQTSSMPYLKPDTFFGKLLVESENIMKLDILDEDLPKSSTSLVNYKDNQMAEKSVLSVQRTNNYKIGVPALNWLPGSKPIRFQYSAGIQTQMQQSMKEYCKKFFDNTNFAQLISSTNIQNNQVDIGLPKYFASFYREPVIQLGSQSEPNTSVDAQEIESKESPPDIKMEAENATQNNELFAQKACAKIIEELLTNTEEDIKNSITVQLDYDEADRKRLRDQLGVEIPKSKLTDLPHYRLSPFLKFSNGHLYLNETFLSTLCVPLDINTNEGNTTACVENLDNYSMDC